MPRIGDCRGLQITRRPAEAAAIFLPPPPAERAKLPELRGGRQETAIAARLPSGGPGSAASPPLPGLCWARR